MPRVELGNARPYERIDGVLLPQANSGPHPFVSYLNIPDGVDEAGNPLYSMPDDHHDGLFPDTIAGAIANADDSEKPRLRRALIDGVLGHASGVGGLPDHAAFTAVVHPNGFWNQVSAPEDDPTWVWSDHPALQQLLADYYGCPAGQPDDLEDTHITQYGARVYPAGAGPIDGPDPIVALHLNSGRDLQAIQMGGFGYLGTVGTATATTATSLTGSAETGVSHASNDCVGNTIYVGKNASGTGSTVYGVITANTSGTTPVYTVDRWYAPESPGGAAATTPNATALYQVVSGTIGTLFVGLTANTTAVSATDTTLTGEITTVGGGLIRKIAPIGHTAAASTWTATPVFTANGSDTLPVTVGKAGYSISITSGFENCYHTLVSPTATLSASGDALTLTWTFTMT
jgi:hypothetical protein